MNKTYAMMALCLAAAAPTASGQILNEDLILKPDDWVFNSGDAFGISVAAHNGIVAVGASTDDVNGIFSGAAYLFDASTGTQLFKLLASDGAADDQFGYSVALDNGVVVVGAIWDDDIASKSGSAYLFDASTGVQLAKLLPNDGEERDWFGYSVALDNGTVAVGAVRDDDNGTDSGSAYVFNASTGAQIAKLLASDGAANNSFGTTIAMDNGVVAVGAIGDNNNGSFSGAAYLFDASTGTQLFKLLASDGAQDDIFGRSIAIDSGIVAIGAPGNDDNCIDTGSAYLFDVTTGAQLAKLLRSGVGCTQELGYSITIDSGVIAVGASVNLASNPVYVFDLNSSPCPGDIADDFGTLGADGMVGFGDFLALLGLVGPCPGGVPGCDGDIADDFGTLGSDGMVSFGDFLALLGLVGPCP